MSHRYNLRSKNTEHNLNNKSYEENVIIGDLNEGPLSTVHLRDDIVNFINKWTELLPSVNSNMISTLNKCDYKIDKYNYHHTCKNIYVYIRSDIVFNIEESSRCNKQDYDSVKKRYLTYFCAEEFCKLTLDNTICEKLKNDVCVILQKVKKLTLDKLQ